MFVDTSKIHPASIFCNTNINKHDNKCKKKYKTKRRKHKYNRKTLRKYK